MMRFIPAYMTFLLVSMGCGSDANFDLVTFAETGEVPVVTGIYVTTVDHPEGTGEIIGSPAYEFSSTAVNVFPNPYVQPDVIRRGDPWSEFSFPRYPVLERVRGTVTIVIVAAQFSNVSGINFSGCSIPVRPNVVRTIRKTDPSQYFTWDLKDDNSETVPTGAYRIYVQRDGSNEFTWVDLSVKRGLMLVENF